MTEHRELVDCVVGGEAEPREEDEEHDDERVANNTFARREGTSG